MLGYHNVIFTTAVLQLWTSISSFCTISDFHCIENHSVGMAVYCLFRLLQRITFFLNDLKKRLHIYDLEGKINGPSC